MNCRHWYVLLLAIATLWASGSATVLAQSSFTFQAPTGPGGTWNIYRLESSGLTFKGANNAANATVDPVTGLLPGRLVSINGALENTTVWNMSGRGDTWIGLTDREGAAPGASEAGTSTTTGYAWTSGEPYTYQNWGGGEPNDFAMAEDAGHIRGDGMWNDNKSGYGLNDPIPPVIVAGSSNDESVGPPSFRYVVEWPTALVAPAPGIRRATFLPSPGSLPGPSGGPAGWGVREIKGLSGSANIIDAIQKATSGTGTITDGRRAILDVTDPQSNANGGPVITTPPLHFLTNTAADDNDIVSIAKGRVSVPASGTYTVQVRSDDGFALRIVGGAFSSINGGNASRGIDPLDPSTMFYYHGTGDADARGVITLAAGEYDLEFIHWEGGGGAFYEVTTGTGASPTTWLPMGAGGSTPFSPNTVRLTAPATVLTAAEGGGMTANNIAQARSLIAAAEAGGTANTGSTNIARVGDGQPVGFPAGTPADEYASLIRGNLTVDDQDATPGESITLTFGLFSDDGHQFRVVGQDFDLATDFTGDGIAGLVDVSGDLSLTADYFTGNTNAFGRITLLEGTYNFESYMFEGGGGADQETWWSVGDKTATGFDSTFRPLSTLLGVEANQGWRLVPEPSAFVLAALGAVGLIGLLRRRK
jgi:PEP-CTERM motif